MRAQERWPAAAWFARIPVSGREATQAAAASPPCTGNFPVFRRRGQPPRAQEKFSGLRHDQRLVRELIRQLNRAARREDTHRIVQVQPDGRVARAASDIERRADYGWSENAQRRFRGSCTRMRPKFSASVIAPEDRRMVIFAGPQISTWPPANSVITAVPECTVSTLPWTRTSSAHSSTSPASPPCRRPRSRRSLAPLRRLPAAAVGADGRCEQGSEPENQRPQRNLRRASAL